MAATLLELISEPKQSVEGITTSVIAAQSQARYEFKRRDATVTADAIIGATTFDIPTDKTVAEAYFVVGDAIFARFNTNTTSDRHEGIGTITAITGDPVVLTVPQAGFVTEIGAFFSDIFVNDLSVSAHIEVTLIDAADDITNILGVNRVLVFVPEPNGTIILDIGDDLADTIALELTEDDPNTLSINYFLQAANNSRRETAGTPVVTSDTLATLGTRQFLNLGGSRMWDDLLKAGPIGLNPITAYITENISGGNVDWFLASGIWKMDGDMINPNTSRVLASDPAVALTNLSTYRLRLTFDVVVTVSNVSVNFVGKKVSDGLWTTINGATQTVTANDVSVNFTETMAQGFTNYGILIDGTGTGNVTIKKTILVPGGRFLTGIGGPVNFTGKKSPLKCWPGWAFFVYYVMDDEFNVQRLLGTTLNVVQRLTDVNGATFGGNALTPDTNTPVEVRRFQTTLHDSIEFPDAFYLRLRIEDGAGAERLIQHTFYELTEECANPIMLEWQNRESGYDQWLFDFDQEIEWQNEAGEVVERPIQDDIETINISRVRVTSDLFQVITLKADQLTIEQISGLDQMKQTPLVWVWLDKAGIKKEAVAIDGTFSTFASTRPQLHNIQIRIKGPRNFDFLRGFEY